MRSFRRQPLAFAGNGAKRTLRRRRGWDGRTRTYNIRVKVWCVTVTLHPTIAALRKEAGYPASRSRGVGDGARTHDTRNHNPVLIPTELHPPFMEPCHGTPGGTRTPGLLLRRQLLYPAELLAHIQEPSENGAGEGNRTLVPSLEGWNSTIELPPHF